MSFSRVLYLLNQPISMVILLFFFFKQKTAYEIPDSAAMWDSTYEEIGDHLRPDTAVMLVLETDVRGEYAGSYTVENAVPARQIPARFGQVACVETDSPEAARSALERLSQLPEGEMEAWVKGPKRNASDGQTNYQETVSLGRGIQPDLQSLSSLRETGKVHVF